MSKLLFSDDPTIRIKGNATVFVERDIDCIEITCMWDIHQRMSVSYTYNQLQSDFDVINDFIESANKYYDMHIASQ